MKNSIISGVGSYVPVEVQKNSDFLEHLFFNEDGSDFTSPNDLIIEKFKSITGIEERRYANDNLVTSDLAFYAAKAAIKNAQIDKEQIDYIIVAHNFGDVKKSTIQSDILPSLASRVKHLLQIENPNCVAYDILFGCPGWIEGVIQAHAFIKAEIATRVLVIGAETLSRVVDKHDRDSMIFSDGAGATIIEASSKKNKGIVSFASQSFSNEEAYYLSFGKSFNKQLTEETRYIKMQGRKIYEFALKNVPLAMKAALDKSKIDIDQVKKIFIHQANEKMDEAIVKRFYRLYKKDVPKFVMPMNIHKLGNSSVATVPTLLDLVLQNKIKNQQINEGDLVLFASVGAGMNINAIAYQF